MEDGTVDVLLYLTEEAAVSGAPFVMAELAWLKLGRAVSGNTNLTSLTTGTYRLPPGTGSSKEMMFLRCTRGRTLKELPCGGAVSVWTSSRTLPVDLRLPNATESRENGAMARRTCVLLLAYSRSGSRTIVRIE